MNWQTDNTDPADDYADAVAFGLNALGDALLGLFGIAALCAALVGFLSRALPLFLR